MTTHETEQSHYLCIHQVPRGGEPEWVRAALRYLTVPYDPELTVIGGTDDEPRRTYRVSFAVVLEGLDHYAPQAAAWWRERGYPTEDRPYFLLWEDEADPIKPIGAQRGAFLFSANTP